MTHSSVLIGDPMIPLTRPEQKNDITVIGNQYHAAPGDTLKIQGHFEDGVYSARIMVLNNKEMPINIP